MAKVVNDLSSQESAFLESIVKNTNLFKFLTTNQVIDLEYGGKDCDDKSLDHRSFLSSIVSKYQEAHQTLRRIMSKSPFILSNNQVAYTIVDDSEVPASIHDGSIITLGYKMLLLTPKYDIGKHKTLIELVFHYPVRILPIRNGVFFIMDENHVFRVDGMERRTIPSHPSHGHRYHLDIYRMFSTNEVKVPGNENYLNRFRIKVKCPEMKQQLMLHGSAWKNKTSPEDQKRRGNEDDFEEMKRRMSHLTSYLTEETLHKLYLLSAGIKDLIVKILFKIHTHQLKISSIVDQFYLKDVPSTGVSYTDLHDKLGETVRNIGSDLDKFFSTSATVSANKFTVFNSCTAKHFDKVRLAGSYITFNNFLTAYTSTDSIVDKVASRSDEVILSFSLPPRTPLILLPDQKMKGSKAHNIIVMPRNMTFYIEEIRPIRVIDNPQTFRKVFLLRFSRFGKTGDEQPLSVENHSVIITHDNLDHISQTHSSLE